MTIPSLPVPAKAPTQDLSTYDSENPPFVGAEMMIGEAQATYDQQPVFHNSVDAASAAKANSSVTQTAVGLVPSTTAAVHTPSGNGPDESQYSILKRKQRIIAFVAILIMVAVLFASNHFFDVDKG
jgi:hypothetical protein